MHAKRTVSTAPARHSPAPAASQSYSYSNLERDDATRADLAEEVALAIAYNGISQAVMLVSPTDLEDFVVGFSLGSGIIASPDEIYDITLSGSGSAQHAQVEIASRAFWNLKTQRRQLAGTSGCGLCGVEALEQALPELQVLPGAPLPPAAWLDGLRQRISAFQPLGQYSGAVHAALFMNDQGEGRQEPHDATVTATQLENQPALEAFTLNQRRQARKGWRMTLGIRGTARIDQFDPQHQAAPADIAQLREVPLQDAQVLAQTRAHGRRVGRQLVFPEITHHRGTGGHGHLIATEGPGMGARG